MQFAFIWMTCIVAGGRAVSIPEAQGAAVLKNAEFTIRICSGRGDAGNHLDDGFIPRLRDH